MSRDQHVTELLARWREGDDQAFEDLVPQIYDELRRLARAQLRRDGAATIQPTELVAEAYLKLVGGAQVDWHGRAHFFSIAARTMRRLLVDRYRARNAARRGSNPTHVTLEDGLAGGSQRQLELDHLDDALNELARLSPRQAEIVTLRFFGGLRGDEIAEVLGVSPRTVKREWSVARRWLYRELEA